MVFLNLLSTAFSAIFYGFIAMLVVMVLYYVIFKAIDKDVVHSKAFFGVGAVLSILLFLQFSLLIGAAQAKSEVDPAEIYLSQLTENAVGTLGINDSQEILNSVITEYPLIGTYIGVCDFSGQSIENIPTVMADTMRSYLSTYIWHRVWWILGFIATAGVLVCVIPGTGRHSGKRLSDESYDDYTSSADTNDWGM